MAGLFIAQTLGAQSPLSEKLVESWNTQGTSWEDSALVNYTRFYNGDSLVGIISRTDGNGGWKEDGASIEMVINGRVYLEAMMDYDQTNSVLVNQYEKDYSYGALIFGGSTKYYLSGIVERTWNKGAQNWDTLFIHQVDADVFRTRPNIIYLVDGGTKDTLSRIQYVYDQGGRIINLIKDSFDMSKSSWIPMWKETNTYSPTNGQLERLDRNYLNGNGSVERQEYFYDDHLNNKRILYSSAASSSGPFTGNYVVDFQRNEFDQITMELYRYIVGQDTINHKRITNSYGTSSVGPDKELTFLQIGPNPCKNYIKVLSKYPLNRVVIYDHMGKACCERTVSGNDVRVDVSALMPGAYILRAVGPDRDHQTRFIIN